MSTRSEKPPRSPWAALLARIAVEVKPTVFGLEVAGARWHIDRDPHGLQDRRREALTRLIYRRYYQSHDHPDAPAEQHTLDTAERLIAPAEEDAVWGRQLRESLGGRHVWESGWVEVGRGPTTVRVAKGSTVLEASMRECRMVEGTLQVRFPAVRPHASAGYFLTLGRHESPPKRDGLVRTYLNLQPDHALGAFADLVRSLDVEGVRFSAKIIDHTCGFGRPDCAVVYAARPDVPLVVRTVLGVRRRHPAAFGSSVPAFTRTVVPGVSLAEEPVGGPPMQSFGRHRSALVASGLLGGSDTGRASERLRAIRAHLADSGLDLARLHLNPGSPEIALEPALGGAA